MLKNGAVWAGAAGGDGGGWLCRRSQRDDSRAQHGRDRAGGGARVRVQLIGHARKNM